MDSRQDRMMKLTVVSQAAGTKARRDQYAL